jgi:hypothetical protein
MAIEIFKDRSVRKVSDRINLRRKKEEGRQESKL